MDRFTIYYILIPGMIFHSLILYAFGVVTLQEMLTIKAVPFIAWSSVMSFVWGSANLVSLCGIKALLRQIRDIPKCIMKFAEEYRTEGAIRHERFIWLTLLAAAWGALIVGCRFALAHL